MTTFSYASEAPAAVKAGLLIVPVFEGPRPGPGVKELGLAEAYAAAKLTGKRGRGPARHEAPWATDSPPMPCC